jgi:hypothetical protein
MVKNYTNSLLTKDICSFKCIPGDYYLKHVPGDYLVKLVERMPRPCKAVIKAKGGYFEESQIKIYILFCLLLHDSICVIS